MMNLLLLTGGDFFMAKNGQSFNQYDEETKMEAVRLRLEDKWTYSMIMNKLNIRSESQILNWVRKFQSGEAFEDYRGRWNKKQFSSVEEENAYLKAQVEYLKKLNPNLHEEGSWISKPGSSPFEK
jgi:Transposase and inactivated derivatives